MKFRRPKGLQRLGWIVAWWLEAMDEQVNPGQFRLFAPPSLWPGWDWAQVNAMMSHAERPWNGNEFVRWRNGQEVAFYHDPEDYDDIEDDGYDSY